MRRVILAVFAGGVLLTGTACDNDPKTSEVAAPAPAGPASAAPEPSVSVSPTPDFSADNAKVCTRLDNVTTDSFGEFGEELGRMIARKEAKATADAKKSETAAAAELKAIGTQIRKETAGAQDPELKKAGIATAARIEASAKNRDYIEKIKSTKDLDATLTDQVGGWLKPVSEYCAASGIVGTENPRTSLSPQTAESPQASQSAQ